jgi:choline dehydrogenase-like flavoprotein
MKNPDSGYYLGVAHNLLYPVSRGSVTLSSADPFATPVIDTNYFSDPDDVDMATVIDAIRQTRHILSAPAWNGYILGPDNTTVNVNTDEEIAEYVRNYSTTVYHAVGTTAMSNGGESGGVVDQHLLVKGAKNLRIVDAGVIPLQIGSHTQAPVYAIAERASDLIKKEHKLF